jgi:cyclophilin family peptidyl-prolyl cis-trans isomerase
MRRRTFVAAIGGIFLVGCASGPAPATPSPATTSKPTAAAKPVATAAGSLATPAAAAKTAAKQWPAAPPMAIDPAKKYTAVITTSKGPITVDLLAKDAPKTVNNFVFLARQGYYDGTIFHRTIKDFMIQGGDPTGTGTGGPGYRFEDEPVTRDYTRGTVAMANAGPNTNGSQFFIVHKDRPLPKNYTIFGQATGGLEALDAIATAPVTAGPGGEVSKPQEPARITSIEIKEG